MANDTKIRISEIMENTDAILGTQDGNALFRNIEVFLRQEDKINLDFTGIVSFSHSASCAFWAKVIHMFGADVVERLSFSSVIPSVVESLEYGVSFVTEQGEKAAV
ncbi:MAG: hypothetical protein JXA11_01790 [Phycisphaerae bacterium]|nr:hypothetical protein [Phycisphaerae bacterium]